MEHLHKKINGYTLDPENGTYKYFKANNAIIAESNFEYDGKVYNYFIISSSILPSELKRYGGVGFPGLSFMFISDNIPLEFIKYFLIHEIICLGGGKPDGHCLCATRKEMELIPENIIKEYLIYRLKFLSDLSSYFKNGDQNLYENVNRSLEFVKSKVKSIGIGDDLISTLDN